ncbi:MAG: DNA/RNA non-specific endonuclease [Colwellia sp.]|nr:DNA/RNA non-specific endonuclease [Colwellia sp.]
MKLRQSPLSCVYLRTSIFICNVDPIIGAESPLDNDDYYNRWDHGHLARRASAAHGSTSRDAKRASDSTLCFTNVCLQFDSFNQDQWLDLEGRVKHLKEEGDDRGTVFSGPIWGDEPLHVVPKHRKAAEAPAAFFKGVCFMDLNIAAFPENIPVDRPEGLTARAGTLLTITDDQVNIFIAGAMPNPKGADRGKEWVSILTLQSTSIDLAGSERSDNKDILTVKDVAGHRIDRMRWNQGAAFPRPGPFLPPASCHPQGF